MLVLPLIIISFFSANVINNGNLILKLTYLAALEWRAPDLGCYSVEAELVEVAAKLPKVESSYLELPMLVEWDR